MCFQSEERLEIYQEKLEKIRNLKDELKSHIAALPDIPQVSNPDPINSQDKFIFDQIFGG